MLSVAAIRADTDSVKTCSRWTFRPGYIISSDPFQANCVCTNPAEVNSVLTSSTRRARFCEVERRRKRRRKMLLLLVIVLLLLMGGGGGYYGYSRWGTGGGLGIVGTVLLIFLVVYLLGGLRFGP